MKDLIKKIIPESMLLKYREIRDHRRVRNESLLDVSSYNHSSNFHLIGSSAKGVKELLIFHSHALEKGLSHPHFRNNFGKGALTGLKSNLDEYRRLNLDTDDFSYQNALSVLKSYKNKHLKKGIDTPFFDSLFKLGYFKDASNIAGTELHLNMDVPKMSFPSLENFRTSQREFKKEPVDMEIFKKVIELATKTPSVCNRQPWKVYVTDNKKKIKKLLEIQKGYEGYGIPPTLSLVTVDKRAFIGSYERNEPYIDGGLFLMNYDFALTYFGISSCILNAMLPNDEQNKIRDLLGASSYEAIIAFVAGGYAKDEVEIAKSARKPVEDVLEFVGTHE